MSIDRTPRETFVPPPPPELKIRTMESDIRSLGKVELSRALETKSQLPLPLAEKLFPSKTSVPKESRLGLKIIIIGLVIGFFIVAGLVGYFFIYPVLRNFLKN